MNVSLASRAGQAVQDAERLFRETAYCLQGKRVPTDAEVCEIQMQRTGRLLGKGVRVKIFPLTKQLRGWKIRFYTPFSFDFVLAVDGSVWLRRELKSGSLDYPYPRYFSTLEESLFCSSNDGSLCSFWERVNFDLHSDRIAALVSVRGPNVGPPPLCEVMVSFRSEDWDLGQLGLRNSGIYSGAALRYLERLPESGATPGTAGCLFFTEQYCEDGWQRSSVQTELSRVVADKAVESFPKIPL